MLAYSWVIYWEIYGFPNSSAQIVLHMISVDIVSYLLLCLIILKIVIVAASCTVSRRLE